MARDCTVNKGASFGIESTGGGPGGSPSQAMVKGGFDSEYASLMAELGETGKGPGPDSARGSWGGGVGDITSSSSSVPPWRRPEVWQSALGPSSTQNTGYRPPQPGYSGYPSGGTPGYGQPGYSGYTQAPSGGYPQSQDYSNYAQYYQGQYAQQTSS
jgi:splicing factor 1